MLIHRVILACLVLAWQVDVFSQVDNIPLSIGLGGGVDIVSNKDLAASPLNYSGVGLPVGLNGFKLSDRWINHVEIQLILPVLTNNYSLSSKVNTQLLDWAKVSVKYQLLRNIEGKGVNFVGGEIESSFFYREYDFLDGYGWEFENSLNVSYARKIDLNDKSFILPQLSVPIIGYLNRKPSLTYDEEFLNDFNREGPISTLRYGRWKIPFDQWLAFELNILYHLNLSNRLNFQSRVGLNFYQISFPEKVQHINIPFRCYLNYQL